MMIEIVIDPKRDEWPRLIRRAQQGDETIAARVKQIVERVRMEGDDALRALTAEIDGVSLTDMEVTPAEIDQVAGQIDKNLKSAISVAAKNIERFHRAQYPADVAVETMPGVRCWQRAVPIRRVGLYVPGGSAPLFSTVLMLAIPARVAGCSEVVLCTPCNKEGRVAPEILYTARLCGVERIFKIGGAQAIAAMACGTDTVPAVDKIFGPGNRYVTYAKQLLSMDTVAIDMPAGPSEVMVLADERARPEFVAADLLSQAEHGIDSQTILVCTSLDFAKKVIQAMEDQLNMLPRATTARGALHNSRIVVMGAPEDMTAFANDYAAEHLIIAMSNPWEISKQITTAASLFIGDFTPESAGDYASGTNHTLPTAGWARAYSGVNLDSFMRKVTYQEITPQGLRHIGATITAMAEAEGLDAHANAVKIRLAALEKQII